jgi:hypothetical protein
MDVLRIKRASNEITDHVTAVILWGLSDEACLMPKHGLITVIFSERAAKWHDEA